MNGARGIAVAGIIALLVTAGHAMYASWPVTHGTEIIVPASLVPLPVNDRLVDVRLAAGRVRGDARALRGRKVRIELAPGLSIAGSAISTREEGYVRLDFGFAPVALPAGVVPPPADTSANAVLLVLPSGRAVLTGVIVNGTRY